MEGFLGSETISRCCTAQPCLFEPLVRPAPEFSLPVPNLQVLGYRSIRLDKHEHCDWMAKLPAEDPMIRVLSCAVRRKHDLNLTQQPAASHQQAQIGDLRLENLTQHLGTFRTTASLTVISRLQRPAAIVFPLLESILSPNLKISHCPAVPSHPLP